MLVDFSMISRHCKLDDSRTVIPTFLQWTICYIIDIGPAMYAIFFPNRALAHSSQPLDMIPCEFLHVYGFRFSVFDSQEQNRTEQNRHSDLVLEETVDFGMKRK